MRLKGRRKLLPVSFLAWILALYTISGCAAGADTRTPKEWLSLSYSGLAAMDQYHFTGSLSMGMDEGVMFKPQMFEGKVVNHHQLTIQSDEKDPISWNPVEVLSKLNQSNAGVKIVREGVMESETGSDKTLTIRVDELPKVTTERWDGLLRQQFNDVAGGPIESSNASAGKRRIVEQSKAELEEMLSRLQATAHYEIVIDKQRLLPLKMEETTSFAYTRNGRPVKESRQTSVRFQKFEGSVDGSVQ
ncbi:hypothetical protein RB620_15615 [Paenibacillus sp. LHD-117]|uniref:hypothetical protein n=1 Tax=Paenibacillus sp. LHD-117 TaxID=3071412 RepID=UPI0027E0ED3B|nr:hypothetical protein [Paenibacillus sp. LHD-117]MDQ6420858.1 hypothetical protein [Paenibacillus sp. LHD-117]